MLGLMVLQFLSPLLITAFYSMALAQSPFAARACPLDACDGVVVDRSHRRAHDDFLFPQWIDAAEWLGRRCSDLDLALLPGGALVTGRGVFPVVLVA